MGFCSLYDDLERVGRARDVTMIGDRILLQATGYEFRQEDPVPDRILLSKLSLGCGCHWDVLTVIGMC
jgi:hypothetical protein